MMVMLMSRRVSNILSRIPDVHADDDDKRAERTALRLLISSLSNTENAMRTDIDRKYSPSTRSVLTKVAMR